MTVEILDPATYGPGEAFKPNSWAQWRCLESTTPDLLYSGRLGASKTRTLWEKGDKRCRKFPGARVLAARRYRAHIGSTMLPILLEKVITPSHREWGWRPAADGGSTLNYPNGSSIRVLGLDEPQRILSSEYDMVLLEQAEELNSEQWDMAAGRLRNNVWRTRDDGTREQAAFQIAGFCNPDSPEHFLYKRFQPDNGSHIEWSKTEVKLPDGRVIPPGDATCECVLAGATDNFENLDVRYLARLHRMKGRWYERMVLGKWVAFEGMVYDNFDANIHVIARPKSWAKWGNYPPPDWPRFRSIDFGYRNPFVCQWWVKDPDGVFILYREIYMTGRTVKQHAGQIKQCEELEVAAARVQIVRENEERTKAGLRPLEMPESVYVTLSVADHDAEDIATLIENDIGAQPAEKDVTPGIQSVYEMLQPRLIGDEMKPALLICNDALVEVDVVLENEGKATCLRQEIASYRYEPPKEGVEKAPKEVPMKVGDHACDAMRYAIHTGRMVGSLDIIFI